GVSGLLRSLFPTRLCGQCCSPPEPRRLLRGSARGPCQQGEERRSLHTAVARRMGLAAGVARTRGARPRDARDGGPHPAGERTRVGGGAAERPPPSTPGERSLSLPGCSRSVLRGRRGVSPGRLAARGRGGVERRPPVAISAARCLPSLTSSRSACSCGLSGRACL